tara:strand:- start:65 stop:1180 length:1116 start_codon:yes stop_codon:yes gene_type:complete
MDFPETEWERIRKIQNEHKRLSELEEQRLIMTQKRKMKKQKAIEKRNQIYNFNQVYTKYIGNPPKITYGLHRCFMENIINQAYSYRISVYYFVQSIINEIITDSKKSSSHALFESWIEAITHSSNDETSFHHYGKGRHYFIKFPIKLSTYECGFIQDIVSHKGPIKVFPNNLDIDYDEVCSYQDKHVYISYLKHLVINYFRFIINCISDDCVHISAVCTESRSCSPRLDTPIAQNIFFNKNEWIIKYYEFFNSRKLFNHLYIRHGYDAGHIYLSYTELLQIKKILSKSRVTPKWDAWMRDKTFRRFASTKEEYLNKMNGYSSRAEHLCHLDRTISAKCCLAFAKIEDIPYDIIELVIHRLNDIYYKILDKP